VFDHRSNFRCGEFLAKGNTCTERHERA